MVRLKRDGRGVEPLALTLTLTLTTSFKILID